MKRRTLIGSVVAAAVAATTGLYRFTDLIVKHYPPTPYDDVLAALADREEAVKFGSWVHDAPAPAALATRLRAALKSAGLAGAAASDVAAGRLVEVNGWVVPESVALLSALAAKV
jgi:hypothetical protein